MIVTIEDPIEFVFDHRYGLVKQRQIGQDTHSFAAGLRAALRQDPDVIVISEMRDLETISAALSAAATGHLVIASLHTMDAPKAFDRIIDAFPPEQQSQIGTQLANALVGVVTQRLLPRHDKPGRVMASDVLVSNMAIQAVIRERRTEQIPGLMQLGSNIGMHTMDDSLAHLLVGGHISLDEALANGRDREYIQGQLQASLRKR